MLPVKADKTLKDKQRWTRSTAFYTCRKILKNIRYADEELNRESITEYIEQICDEMKITREDCGIYAADRAQLYFRGKTYDIGFDDLQGLAQKGADLLIIEKEGGAEQLAPLAAKKGIALLNARGFLAEIARKYRCNIAILSDLDIYGLTICSKIPNVHRIGISFETLRYFGLNFEDVEEQYNAPSFDMDFSKFATEEELEYLKPKRIEIDSVMIAVNDNQKFWDYIVKKLQEKFPTRDYNRAIDIPEHVVPTTLEKLNYMVRILSTIVEGAVKPFFLSAKYEGEPQLFPMIDLALGKEAAVQPHIFGMLYDNWTPNMDEEGATVFLRGYEKRGPNNERKRIYYSAVTPQKAYAWWVATSGADANGPSTATIAIALIAIVLCFDDIIRTLLLNIVVY